MFRALIGIALLAGSWLLGLSYYHPAQPAAWLVAVLAGMWLLSGTVRRIPPPAQLTAALILTLPAVWFLPWPDRAAPLAMAAGLALVLLPFPAGWIGRVGWGAVVGSVVLLAQAIALAGYTAFTARSHDLPEPLPALLAALVRALGVEAAQRGSEVVWHSTGQAQHLAATWDLLVDPASVCFFAGGAVLLALRAWAGPGNAASGSPAARWRRWSNGAGALLAVMIVWLPLRTLLLIACYVQRDLRADVPLGLMNQFLSPWVHLALLIGPVVLLWRLSPRDEREGGTSLTPGVARPERAWRSASRASAPYHALSGRATQLTPLALAVLAAAAWATAMYWEPAGVPKARRVMFVERHSTWSPTTRPYDTHRYGDEGSYNYGAIFDYCRHYFSMARLREADAIDDRTLSQCDVLVIKIPTERYTAAEVAAVVRFVDGGGGLLLIGDHTNVSRSGTYLNDIARRFGFFYRYDVLFGMDLPYDDFYAPPALAPHPIVQRVPPFDFAVSCSIDPGWSAGRAAITGTGLWSLGPDYNQDNYHPLPLQQPEMRYGAFIQLWAMRHGQGRVAAFTDSTIFSNFCAFEPGKSEMMLGLLQWLNQRNGMAGDPRGWLLLAAGLLTLAALAAAQRWRAGWLLLTAAGLSAFAASAAAVAQINRWSLPAAKPDASLVRVAIDRTVSNVPLAKDGFSQDLDGYGALEQWLPRLGCATARRSGPDAFGDAALVVICPEGPVSDDYRRRLTDYVEHGGRMLVFDSPENRHSTANNLLWRFGLSIQNDQVFAGGLTFTDPQQPTVAVERAWVVSGGEPLARLGDKAVAARAAFGQGVVVAVGFASAFNDRAMMGGEVPQWESLWTVEPTQPLLDRYEALYHIVRMVVACEPTGLVPKAVIPQGTDLPPRRSKVRG